MRCDECGFDWDMDPADVGPALRAFADRYPRPLSRFLPGEDPEVLLRTRPEPAVWSAIEYAAHVRDALTFYAERVERVLTETRPQLEGFDADELCRQRAYNDDDPTAVAAAIGLVARALADRVDGLDESQWGRVGIGSGGDERTALRLGRSAAHEGSHHMLDIGRVLRHVREAR